jgi:outer membrane protein
MGIAIAILFILHFSNEPQKSSANEEQNTNSVLSVDENEPENINDFKIAFVNSDTLAKYYDFSKKLKADLLKKQSKAESQIKKKYANYQKLVSEYQQAAEIMGQNEAAQKVQTINMLEQEIMQLEQTLSQNYANQELEASNKYVNETADYLQIIGANLGYDYILSYRVGGPMLFANPSLDITQDIIGYLNEEYNKNND